MLNYNSPINDKKEYSDLIMSEIEPIIKINIRGKKRDFLTKIGKTLSTGVSGFKETPAFLL